MVRVGGMAGSGTPGQHPPVPVVPAQQGTGGRRIGMGNEGG